MASAKALVGLIRGSVAASAVLAPFLLGQATAEGVNRRPLLLLASNVSNAAIEPLVPRCSRAANVEVQPRFANNPAVAEEVRGGAAFDVVILEAGMLRDLASEDRVSRESIRPLAALRMGIATRQRRPVPWDGTLAAFERTLLRARSIGFAGDGHSGEVFLAIIDRLHLRDRLRDRLVPFTGGYPGAVRASANTQLIVAPFFRPLPVPLRLVGYFPRSLGADVAIAAGQAVAARPEAAAFIACLRSPASRAVFRSRGYRVDE